MPSPDPLLLLAAVTLLVAVVLAVELTRGLRSLPRLVDMPAPETSPSITVVIAARNEAPHVATAVLSVLGQDYPALDVVAVDDRSSDGTGHILDHLADTHDRLQVLHVSTLPHGWLGKNHALQRGAEVADGELILFTDADVIMSPSAVARAVTVVERLGLDHLAVAPRIRAGSRPAMAVVAVFMSLFSIYFRPWKARDRRSRAHIGIGAFNLVRATAYRDMGGHGAIPLRPDDDVRLGRALKRAGYRQATASGTGLVEVEWYSTLRAMRRGLRKNAFAVVDYRLAWVTLGTLPPLLLVFWPVAALFLTTGAVWWLNAGVVAVGVLTIGDTARVHGLPLWTGLTYPLGSLALLWITWAAALRAVRRGSVEWRGTEYPLELLRSSGKDTPGGPA